MNSLKSFLLMGALCLVTAGCTSYGDEEGPRETIYASGEADIDMTYPEMAREMSNGSVKVFGLDGPPAPIVAPPPSRGPMMAPVLQGVSSTIDPNVTVYPFEDEQPLYSETTPRPLLAPPSQQYRPLSSPFGGPIQTPAEGPYVSPAPIPYQPMSPPAPAPVYPVNDEVSRIYFKHGSAMLTSTDKQVVNHVAQSNPAAVVVDGHASERAEVSDPVAREIVNLEMSMKRAVKVSSDLIRSGVPVERIETRAFGTARPAPPVPGINQEAANRRVEIHTEGGEVYPVPAYPLGSRDLSPMEEGSGNMADITDLTEPAPIPPLARY